MKFKRSIVLIRHMRSLITTFLVNTLLLFQPHCAYVMPDVSLVALEQSVHPVFAVCHHKVLRGIADMKMKVIAGLAFLLNTLLFGSYYSVAKEVLGRVDPIVFTFFAMMTLVPPAIVIIAFSWRHMTRDAVKSGFVLGSCLCLGLFTLSVALKYNSATGTAFFPSLNGLLAAFFTWMVLRQPITKATWFAGSVSVVGAILLMVNASMGGPRGALIAFIGGLLCTFYVFLADHEQKDLTAYWPMFGVELLTMAVWANLIALLFGDWQMVHFSVPKDVGIVLYIGIGTTFLPTLITVLLQKYISPITVSFIYILEPILGAIVAFIYLHEVLPLDGYLGGGLIVAGALIHTWIMVERPSSKLVLQRRLSLTGQRMHASLFGSLIYPVLCCVAGIFVVYHLGGFPPTVWRDLYILSPQIPSLFQQGHGTDVLLLFAQSSSWLIAWIAIVVMGAMATYRAIKKIFVKPAKVDVDVRSLRQMGYTPYVMSSPTNRRKTDSSLVQHRRQKRRERFTRSPQLRQQTTTYTLSETLDEELFEPAETTFISSIPRDGARRASKTRLIAFSEREDASPSTSLETRLVTLGEQPTTIKKRENYNDAFGNHWVYWDDLGTTEMREL